MATLGKLLMFSFKNLNVFRPGCFFFKGFKRNFSLTTMHLKAYDPDGKTIVSVMNNEKDAPLMINSYSTIGFRLNNGLFAVGPIAIFPRSILSWNIKDDHEINESSLSLFLHLAPKLDILLIGLSDSRDKKLLLKIREYLYELMKDKGAYKTNVEVLPTEKAVSTFNFLNAESRFVGAALIPPTFYEPTLDDQYRTEYLRKKVDGADYLVEDK